MCQFFLVDPQSKPHISLSTFIILASPKIIKIINLFRKLRIIVNLTSRFFLDKWSPNRKIKLSRPTFCSSKLVKDTHSAPLNLTKNCCSSWSIKKSQCVSRFKEIWLGLASHNKFRTCKKFLMYILLKKSTWRGASINTIISQNLLTNSFKIWNYSQLLCTGIWNCVSSLSLYSFSCIFSVFLAFLWNTSWATSRIPW